MDSCPVCCRDDGEEKADRERELKKCAGCLSVVYCSSDHQKQHWKTHKKDCRPFKIVFDPLMSKTVVATRDLKPGVLLLYEKTKFYYAKWNGYSWVCLSCGLDFQGDRPRLCSTCQWPVCSSACEKIPIHKDNECVVFSQQKIQFPPSPEMYNWFAKKFGIRLDDESYSFITYCIVCIRGLRTKIVDNLAYKQMMNEFFNKDEKDKNSFVHGLDIHLTLLRKLVDIVDLLGSDITREELRQFVKVVNGNNFIYHEEDSVVKRAKIGGTFVQSSRFNHSCSPNAASSVLPFPSVKIRTITNVKKGEPLSIEYLHNGIESLPKRERQERIFNKWSFKCQCQRCLDPTDNGTYMDSFACPNCRPLGVLARNETIQEEGVDTENLGYLLPVSPLDFDYSSVWKCNNSGCEMEQLYGALHKQMNKLKEELTRLIKKNEVELFENFIEENSQKVLHPNHWLLIEATTGILKHLASSQLKMDRSDFDKFIEKHRYRLNIVDKQAPGMSKIRAFTLRQSSAWIFNTFQIIPQEFTVEEQRKYLELAKMYSSEALLYYKLDSDILQEQKTYTQIVAFTLSTIEDKLKELSVF